MAGTVLTRDEIARAIRRIAHEILERNKGSQNLVLLGIPTRGAILAQRLVSEIFAIEKSDVPIGTLDITLHRDDLRTRPPKPLSPTHIPASGIENRDVILVDDVFFSGRTIRAALDALGQLGRPSSVQLAVLVDRGHRELPIRADYVGKNLPTSRDESVKVHLTPLEADDEVVINSL
jgi:pyrimidine operon attenuation protein / uracil phosphoribosyltransferase